VFHHIWNSVPPTTRSRLALSSPKAPGRYAATRARHSSRRPERPAEESGRIHARVSGHQGSPPTELNVIETLADLFLLRGVPAHIRSDQGWEFIAEAVKSWIGAVGADRLHRARQSTVRYPRYILRTGKL